MAFFYPLPQFLPNINVWVSLRDYHEEFIPDNEPMPEPEPISEPDPEPMPEPEPISEPDPEPVNDNILILGPDNEVEQIANIIEKLKSYCVNYINEQVDFKFSLMPMPEPISEPLKPMPEPDKDNGNGYPLPKNFFNEMAKFNCPNCHNEFKHDAFYNHGCDNIEIRFWDLTQKCCITELPNN